MSMGVIGAILSRVQKFLDTTVSSRASQVSVDSLSVIKNIQRGSTTININDLGVNVAITAVNLAKTIVIHSVRAPLNDATAYMTTAVLTNSTTLRLARDASTSAIFVEWQVIEFK